MYTTYNGPLHNRTLVSAYKNLRLVSQITRFAVYFTNFKANNYFDNLLEVIYFETNIFCLNLLNSIDFVENMEI